jgi:RND superfamily putative drug exporter
MKFLSNSGDYINQEPTAMSGLLVSELDPLGKDAQLYLDTLVALFDKYGPEHNVEIYVGGMPAYAVDMVRKVFQLFPVMIVATLSVAFLFLGYTFRSIVLPCRAILVNLFCLGLTYGLSVLVYQEGILNWMNWFAVSGELQALPWLVPVIIFFVLTGIGLDYDVFLCVRITEYRNDGLDPIQAIRSGLSSVGGIIASAGLVMIVAFGAELLSSLQQLNILGFMTVIAITFCTMVACTVVNPAVLSILGRHNWWPSELSKQSGGAVNDMGQSLQPASDRIDNAVGS